MGCTSSKSKGLPERIRIKLLKIFQSIDKDNNKSIDREETKQFWKQKFAKLQTDELFKTIDYDGSGTITQDEWMSYWEMVKKSGHTNEEIEIEVDKLSNGESWVKFSKVKKYQQNEDKLNEELNEQKKKLHLEDGQAAKRISRTNVNDNQNKQQEQQKQKQ